MTRQKPSPHEWEDLSAYLDDELSPDKHHKLEERLRHKPELRSALETLRPIRHMLRSQAALRAPRNFTLTPQMVGVQPARLFVHTWARVFSPALGLCSALASVLFVVVLLAEFLAGGSYSGMRRMAAEVPAEKVLVEVTAPVEMLKAPPPAAEAAVPVPTEALAKAMDQAQATLVPTFPVTEGVGSALAPYPAGGEALSVTIPQVSATLEVSAELYLPALTAVGEMEMRAQLAYPVPAETESENQAISVYPSPQQPSIQPAVAYFTGWRFIQVLLGVVAIGAGLGAFYLRRLGRK